MGLGSGLDLLGIQTFLKMEFFNLSSGSNILENWLATCSPSFLVLKTGEQSEQFTIQVTSCTTGH